MRAMQERRIVAEALVCVRTDNSKFPVVVTAAPIMRDGVVIGAVQDLRDITEEQMLEQTKSNFISLVSHELRTPLTLLRWSLEKLKLRTDLPPDVQSGVIPPMESAANRTLSLVRAMLDVSKIETNTFETTETEIQISSLVEKSLAELRPFIEDKQIVVEVEHEAGTETKILSDERLLQIIVNNVLSNATRYTEVGGRIKVRLKGEEGKGVELSVENTGPGIPPEEQPHIFKKMFRGEAAQRQNPDGSGLGLYITKSFIERLGGSVTFDSTRNATTFTIRFPYTYR
jgi:signal transduction histidine kinase